MGDKKRYTPYLNAEEITEAVETVSPKFEEVVEVVDPRDVTLTASQAREALTKLRNQR
jgi:RNase H-fold protein (predicted Holliday junction resolvase)